MGAGHSGSQHTVTAKGSGALGLVVKRHDVPDGIFQQQIIGFDVAR